MKSATDGVLVIGTPWSGDVKVNWTDIAKLKTENDIKVLLSDDSELNGTVTPLRDDEVALKTDLLMTRIKLGDVLSINAVEEPAVKWSGSVRAGGIITDGNTRTREAVAEAQVVMRADRIRLLLHGVWNYAESRKGSTRGVSKRNALGEIKMDFFLSEKLYVFAHTLAQADRFQDLDLRTAMSAGLGYQWIETDALKISTEGGLAYVDENRRTTVDQSTLAMRGGWQVDYTIVADQVAFFHLGQVFPSVEQASDVFLTTSTGLRFSIYEGFFATTQVDFNYDNTPATRFGRRDTIYSASIGYAF